MSQATVLLVEDNENILEINGEALRMEGYAVQTATTLGQARACMAGIPPDVLVLDIMLPDGSGLDFCAEVRQSFTAPILFLTCRNEKEDIIAGLKTGGDDYLTKPYHIDELVTRVGALLRRVRLDRQSHQPRLLTFGALTLDVVAMQATLNGVDLLLTQKEFSLLLYLVQNKDKVLTADELYKKVWNMPMGEDKRALQIRVSALRAKLAGSGVKIVNEYGKGYRFREC